MKRDRKPVKRVKDSYLKYAVYNKKTESGQIYHYKTQLAELLGVSTRTLDRRMPFEDENYLVFKIERLNL